jgi:hypothetical protein
MPLAAIPQMLQNKAAISVSRHAPAGILVHDGNIPVLSVGSEKLVVKI